MKSATVNIEFVLHLQAAAVAVRRTYIDAQNQFVSDVGHQLTKTAPLPPAAGTAGPGSSSRAACHRFFSDS